VEGWGFVASEGFEPPKAEPADLQLSDERLVVGQNGNVPQYFISQATLCRYARFRPFPSIERNLNGILGSPGKRKAGPKNVMAGTKKQRKRCREPMFSRLIRLES
jgi:hypothetical protein